MGSTFTQKTFLKRTFNEIFSTERIFKEKFSEKAKFLNIYIRKFWQNRKIFLKKYIFLKILLKREIGNFFEIIIKREISRFFKRHF